MATEHTAHDENHGHHKTPWKILYGVFAALIILTIVTYLTAEYVDLGMFNVPLALAIAVAKAALVVMFFMALWYDTRVNMMVFVVGSLFVLVFIGITLLDTNFRGFFEADKAITVKDREAEEQVLGERDEIVRPQFEAQPLVNTPDSTRFPNPKGPTQ